MWAKCVTLNFVVATIYNTTIPYRININIAHEVYCPLCSQSLKSGVHRCSYIRVYVWHAYKRVSIEASYISNIEKWHMTRGSPWGNTDPETEWEKPNCLPPTTQLPRPWQAGYIFQVEDEIFFFPGVSKWAKSTDLVNIPPLMCLPRQPPSHLVQQWGPVADNSPPPWPHEALPITILVSHY